MTIYGLKEHNSKYVCALCVVDEVQCFFNSTSTSLRLSVVIIILIKIKTFYQDRWKLKLYFRIQLWRFYIFFFKVCRSKRRTTVMSKITERWNTATGLWARERTILPRFPISIIRNFFSALFFYFDITNLKLSIHDKI